MVGARGAGIAPVTRKPEGLLLSGLRPTGTAATSRGTPACNAWRMREVSEPAGRGPRLKSAIT
jgi:hypothetical protein